METNKNELVIIISGKMLTGKNTVMDILEDFFFDLDYNVARVSFARKLKKDVCNYLQIPEEKAYTQEGKKEVFTSPAGRVTTLREFLQSHGENMKKTFGKLYWTNKAVDDARTYISENDIPICDDARFPFELNAFAEHFKNPVFILVTRPDDQRGINPKDSIHKHESETEIPELDHPIWDFVISNDELGIEKLRKKVGEVFSDIAAKYLT